MVDMKVTDIDEVEAVNKTAPKSKAKVARVKYKVDEPVTKAVEAPIEVVKKPVVKVKSADQAPINKFMVRGKVRVINGTVTMPEGSGLRLILVPCAEHGKPEGALFDLLNRKWRAAKVELKGWYQMHTTFKLGAVKEVATQSDVWLMNMLCLDKDNKVNDKALVSCLKEVSKIALYEHASIHCSSLVVDVIPEVQDLLNTYLVEKGVSVSFYQETKNK